MTLLTNSLEIPAVGFGVYQVSEPGAARQAVLEAVRAGYRLIDTAASYGNEREVGEAIHALIAEGTVTRDDLFVTTKLWVQDANYAATTKAIADSLARLQLDYVDLYLIHQPFNDIFGAWRAIETAYEAGKLKAIGVSNFSIAQLTNLAEFSQIKPMVNQIEVNPFNQNIEAVAYFQSYGVTVEAWAPFAEGKNGIFTNGVLQAIADAHGKSIAQVILKWLTQRHIVPLAKSVQPVRMNENISIHDFTLTDNDMRRIAALDKHESQFFSHANPEIIKWMASRTINYDEQGASN